ncbi:MAG: Ig-like domain-containing protein, partial [Firmicutes bacterium]|nr:Ig-like domain-containing protein [Bacillota bacterium]
MTRKTSRATAFVLSFLMVFSVLFTGVPLMAAEAEEWDVIMEFSTDFREPWAMPGAWIPMQGWVGNGGGGDNMSLAAGANILGDAAFRERVLQYNATASPRGGQANLHVPIESNYRIDMSFEWFPGIPAGTGATAYGKLSINDSHAGGFSNSGGIQANQFINFMSSNWSEDVANNRGLTFVIGNVLDSVAFRGGVGTGAAGGTMPLALNHVIDEAGHPEYGQLVVGERHAFGTNSHRGQWLTINLSLDFVNQKITVHVVVSETGEVLVDNEVHPFAHQTDETGPFAHWNSDGSSGFWTHHPSGNPTTVTRMGQLGGGAVTWNRQIAGFRFQNAGHWRTQIDNMSIQGLVPYVPPVLVAATNMNAAQGTFDLEIAPYSVPAGATLNHINIFATTTADGVTGLDTLVATVPGAGTHTISVPRGNATHVITAEAVVNGSPTNRSNALTVVHEGVLLPRPLTVTDLIITAQQGQMNLTWTPVANADEYIIYRAFFQNGPFERVGVVTGETVFTDNHPRHTNNFHSFFKIEAIGDAGSGGLSRVFASTLSGYIPQARIDGLLDRALVGIYLGGDRGAETLVSAAGPNGETLTSGVYLSWRWFNADFGHNTTFTLYRNGVPIYTGLTVTNLVDPAGGPFDVYRIVGSSDAAQNLTSPGIRVWNNFFLDLQLYQPPMQIMQNGQRVHYIPNDIIVGDLTGSGTLDMVVKWFPNNARDASVNGQTGSAVFDAYTVDWNTGETILLWRVDLGWNMRASSHYQMFGLADFRGIGRSDVMMNAPTSARFFRSTDGTDQGLVELNYRVGNGNINANPTTAGCGASHIIAIDGTTGSLIGAADRPTPASAHQRSTAAVGYVRGHDQRPSFITGGQYGALDIREWRITGDAPDWQVVMGWSGPAGGGNANHNMHTADIHGLGFDSILMGAAVIVPNSINEDAFGSAAVAGATGMRVLNNVGVHGNASQFGHFISEEVMFEMMSESGQLPEGVTSADDLRLPNNHPRQVIAYGQEGQMQPNRPSFIVRDVLSGASLVTWNSMPFTDMRRGMIAHIDPSFPNAQTWADKSPTYLGDGEWGPPARDGSWDERESGIFALERFADHTNNPANRRGELYQIAHTNPSMNYSLFWSGSLLSELQCHDFNERAGFFPISAQITMWDYINHREILMLCSTEVFANNGTKGTPAIQADIVGDWREEVILRVSDDNSRVRVHRTTIQTDYVIPWLWEDHNYRLAITWQANGYNQPPGTSFMPSRGVVTARDINYFTLSAEGGVVITYSPAGFSEQFGFPITGHQLWRRNGDRGIIDLTPRGTLSNSTRIQLLEAGYVLIDEVAGSGPLTDVTAVVGGTYSYVIVGVSDTAAGQKLNHISVPVTFTIEDRHADVASITVTPDSYNLEAIGNTVQLTATVLPQNVQNSNVVWESSDKNVATVSANGLVTAVGSGTATVRAISVINAEVYSTSEITVNIPTYQVTFMLDETEVFLIRSVYMDAPMGDRFPLSPFRAGYSFVGWFDALEEGSQFTAATVVTEDITVFARFVPAGDVTAGDRWQFNFRMPASPATPDGWIEIPLGAANDTFADNTPRLPGSMAEIGSTGVMFGVGPGPGGAGPSTRGGHTTVAGWWGQNPDGITGADRFGNPIIVPRDVGTGWVSIMELGLNVPNGAFDVIAFIGNAIGGAPRGGLLIHGEPRNTAVRISANPTNLIMVYASRPLYEIPGNQNVDNNRPFALSHANNVIVRDGYLGITPYQWNANTQAFIIVVVALHAPIEEAIAAAARLNSTDYSVSSWNVLMEAIGVGQAAMTRGGSNYVVAYNQAEIDAFAQAIWDAIDGLEAPLPVVTGVTVSPATVTVQQGATQTFTATVYGTNNPAQTVTWAVEGSTNPETAISDTGMLTVAANETAMTLTVVATSAVDTNVYGTAAVTVAAVAVPVFTWDIFNNGPEGSPSRPHADHAAVGRIRMFT